MRIEKNISIISDNGDETKLTDFDIVALKSWLHPKGNVPVQIVTAILYLRTRGTVIGLKGAKDVCDFIRNNPSSLE